MNTVEARVSWKDKVAKRAELYRTGQMDEASRKRIEAMVEGIRAGMTREEVGRAMGWSGYAASEAVAIYEAATGERLPRQPTSRRLRQPVAAVELPTASGDPDEERHSKSCQCRTCVRGREIDAEVRLRRRLGWGNEWTLEDYAMRRRVADGSRLDKVEFFTPEEKVRMRENAAPEHFGMNKMHRKEAVNG